MARLDAEIGATRLEEPRTTRQERLTCDTRRVDAGISITCPYSPKP